MEKNPLIKMLVVFRTVYIIYLSITANRTCRFGQAAKMASAQLSMHNLMHIYRL